MSEGIKLKRERERKNAKQNTKKNKKKINLLF